MARRRRAPRAAGIADFDPALHPRGPGGRWAPKPEVVAAAPAEDGIKNYIGMVARMRGDQPSPEAFLLKNGRAYPMDADSWPGGTAHECYKNAALAAMGDPELTYVEGYVSVHGVPIAHAWTATRAGTVRDMTIGESRGIVGYYGVPMTTKFLGEQLLTTKIYGLLSGHPRDVQRVLKEWS